MLLRIAEPALAVLNQAETNWRKEEKPRPVGSLWRHALHVARDERHGAMLVAPWFKTNL